MAALNKLISVGVAAWRSRQHPYPSTAPSTMQIIIILYFSFQQLCTDDRRVFILHTYPENQYLIIRVSLKTVV